MSSMSDVSLTLLGSIAVCFMFWYSCKSFSISAITFCSLCASREICAWPETSNEWKQVLLISWSHPQLLGHVSAFYFPLRDFRFSSSVRGSAFPAVDQHWSHFCSPLLCLQVRFICYISVNLSYSICPILSSNIRCLVPVRPWPFSGFR